MTPVRWITVAAALSVAVMLAGCSEESAGSPLPDDTVTTDSKTDTSEPTTSTEPSSQRPREIRLDDKDPCGLIPQTDWPKFDIERPGTRSEEPTFKSPHCYYSGSGDVTLVVTEGIEAWREENRNAEVEDADPIEGFPTITMWNKADQRSCYTAVDVADGQYLMTTAAPIVADPEKSESCDFAYQFAESAMTTLVAS